MKKRLALLPVFLFAACAAFAAEKEWTVMAYLNGNSDIEKYCLEKVNYLEQAGSTDKVNFVVELARMRGQREDDISDGDWTGARRYLLARDGDMGHIASAALQSFGNTDMADWRHLADFISWAKQNYPAKHYVLIVFGHATA